MSPPSFVFPQPYMLSMIPYGLGHPFGVLESAVQAVSPPSLLCTPSPLAGGVRSRKGLDLCKHCSAIRKTFLCYQHCFQDKSKTLPPIPATVKEMNAIPAKTSTTGFLEQSMIHLVFHCEHQQDALNPIACWGEGPLTRLEKWHFTPRL